MRLNALSFPLLLAYSGDDPPASSESVTDTDTDVPGKGNNYHPKGLPQAPADR